MMLKLTAGLDETFIFGPGVVDVVGDSEKRRLLGKLEDERFLKKWVLGCKEVEASECDCENWRFLLEVSATGLSQRSPLSVDV